MMFPAVCSVLPPTPSCSFIVPLTPQGLSTVCHGKATGFSLALYGSFLFSLHRELCDTAQHPAEFLSHFHHSQQWQGGTFLIFTAEWQVYLYLLGVSPSRLCHPSRDSAMVASHELSV